MEEIVTKSLADEIDFQTHSILVFISFEKITTNKI